MVWARARARARVDQEIKEWVPGRYVQVRTRLPGTYMYVHVRVCMHGVTFG